MRRFLSGRWSLPVIAGVVTSAVIAGFGLAAGGPPPGTPSHAATGQPIGTLTLAQGGTEIPVLAWSFGASNSGTAHTGGGAGAGKANFQDLSLTKFIDSNSAAILTALATGQHYPKIVFTSQWGTGSTTATLVYELTDAIFTSFSQGGSGGESALTENVSINYAKIKWTYTDATGTTTGSWDVAQNTP